MGKVIDLKSKEEAIYFLPGEEAILDIMFRAADEMKAEAVELRPDGYLLARLITDYVAANKETIKHDDYMNLLAVGAELISTSKMIYPEG